MFKRKKLENLKRRYVKLRKENSYFGVSEIMEFLRVYEVYGIKEFAVLGVSDIDSIARRVDEEEQFQRIYFAYREFDTEASVYERKNFCIDLRKMREQRVRDYKDKPKY